MSLFGGLEERQARRSKGGLRLSGPLSSYIESLLYVDGYPWSYKGREHYLPIVNTDVSTLLLKTARQCEKSVALASNLITPAVLIPRYRCLYLVPSFPQAKEFSETKLRMIARDSPWIAKHRLGKWTKDAVILKTYSNGSRIDLRYAFYTADRTRGIKADCLAIDELQDVLLDNIPIAEQTLKHSQPPPGLEHLEHLYKRRIFSGTPKSLQNPIEVYWKGSTQCEWIVPCRACKRWNTLNHRKNIGQHGPICMYCQRPVFPGEGMWHAENPPGEYLGFHISTLMVPAKGNVPVEMRPWLDWRRDVLEPAGMIPGIEGYPEVQFQNEVLGLPCDDAKNAVTQEEIRICCKPDWHMAGYGQDIASYQDSRVNATTLYAGVDWGEARPSRTVLTIGGFFEPTRFSVLFIKSYDIQESDDPLQLVRDVIKWCTAFKVAVIGADKGHGWTANPMLAEVFGWDRVAQFQYTVGSAPRLNFDPAKHQWSTNRTQVLSEFFLDIKRDRIRFPSWEEFGPYHTDITSIFTEYSPKLRTQTYSHNPQDRDDLTHAVVYARLAGELWRQHTGSWSGI